LAFAASPRLASPATHRAADADDYGFLPTITPAMTRKAEEDEAAERLVGEE
jgi:hypothetical protein